MPKNIALEKMNRSIIVMGSIVSIYCLVLD